MSKSHNILAGLLIFLVVFNVAQEEDVITTDQQDSGEFNEAEQSDFKLNQDMDKDKIIELQRNNLLTCFVLTKNLIHQETAQITQFLKDRNQNAFYKKLVATSMKNCFQNIPFEISADFLQKLQSEQRQTLDFKKLFNYLNFDLTKFEAPGFKVELDEEEKQFYEYAENLDRQMKEKYGSENEESEGYENQDYDYEPSIAGLSLKETKGPFVTLYALGIISVFFGAVYLAYKHLFEKKSFVEQKLLEKKKKKEEKKKQ